MFKNRQLTGKSLLTNEIKIYIENVSYAIYYFTEWNYSSCMVSEKRTRNRAHTRSIIRLD